MERLDHDPIADSPLARALTDALTDIDRAGDFFAEGALVAPPPNVVVQGVGQLAFPLQPHQAAQLQAVARRAPYGKGPKTLVDTSVRDTWQLEPAQVTMDDPHWSKTLAKITLNVLADLGIKGRVLASFYKALLYAPGGFFAPHRDTEKVAGMFATLIVVLPSAFEGGEVIIHHQEESVALPMRANSPSGLAYGAFYADCVHEVRPLRSGYRLCLVYNLAFAADRSARLLPPDHSEPIQAVASLLARWPAEPTWPAKVAYVLEHAYSIENLSFDHLKDQDAAALTVLEAAAAQTDTDLHLALLRVEEWGHADPGDLYDRYEARRRGRHWYDDDDDDDDEEDRDELGEEEVIGGDLEERTLCLERWVDLQNDPVPFGELAQDARDLFPQTTLDALQPDKQRLLEATGNEGATFTRTYRRARAVASSAAL